MLQCFNLTSDDPVIVCTCDDNEGVGYVELVVGVKKNDSGSDIRKTARTTKTTATSLAWTTNTRNLFKSVFL